MWQKHWNISWKLLKCSPFWTVKSISGGGGCDGGGGGRSPPLGWCPKVWSLTESFIILACVFLQTQGKKGFRDASVVFSPGTYALDATHITVSLQLWSFRRNKMFHRIVFPATHWLLNCLKFMSGQAAKKAKYKKKVQKLAGVVIPVVAPQPPAVALIYPIRKCREIPFSSITIEDAERIHFSASECLFCFQIMMHTTQYNFVLQWLKKVRKYWREC